ncbi:MAG TPA: HipA domain-containing protein [Gemmatimonadaceae bacterium]|jgi:HipA-like C-terminal domain.
MELARRAGLDAAPVRPVDFGEKSPFRGRSLLVERYDIPDRAALDRDQAGLELMLQEDACSILLLARTEKYRTSLERVATALCALGLSDDPAALGLWCPVRHVTFSWLVANGDLHAKNVSALRIIRPGTLGAFPELTRLEYSPLYDLLNTTLVIPDDDFALPVKGKKNRLRVRDIAELAERWKGARSVAEEQIMAVAAGVRRNLDDVLGCAHLPEAMAERYRRVVDGRLRAFGV